MEKTISKIWVEDAVKYIRRYSSEKEVKGMTTEGIILMLKNDDRFHRIFTTDELINSYLPDCIKHGYWQSVSDIALYLKEVSDKHLNIKYWALNGNPVPLTKKEIDGIIASL